MAEKHFSVPIFQYITLLLVISIYLVIDLGCFGSLATVHRVVSFIALPSIHFMKGYLPVIFLSAVSSF